MFVDAEKFLWIFLLCVLVVQELASSSLNALFIRLIYMCTLEWLSCTCRSAHCNTIGTCSCIALQWRFSLCCNLGHSIESSSCPTPLRFGCTFGHVCLKMIKRVNHEYEEGLEMFNYQLPGHWRFLLTRHQSGLSSR